MMHNNEFDTMGKCEDSMVSVIVPAYNVAGQIGFCLRSLAEQTYPAFEVIVVDDGSTDSTGEIAHNASERDGRIRVASQENLGVSIARNRGMQESRGRYLVFLDGDDELPKNALKILVDTITESQTDMAFGAYEIVDGDERTAVCEFPKGWVDERHTGHETLKLLLSCADITPTTSAWRIIYDAPVLKASGALFPPGVRMGEDFCFMLDVLATNPNVAVTDKVVYYYRRRECSVTQVYIPSYATDTALVNEKIRQLSEDDETLCSLYWDRVATTCFRQAQNERLRPDVANHRKACAAVLTDSKFSESIKLLKLNSTIGIPKALFLKSARKFPDIFAALISHWRLPKQL